MHLLLVVLPFLFPPQDSTCYVNPIKGKTYSFSGDSYSSYLFNKFFIDQQKLVPCGIWYELNEQQQAQVLELFRNGIYPKYSIRESYENNKKHTEFETLLPIEVEPEILTDLGKLITYPELAKDNGIEGKVIFRVLIGSDGKPKETIIISSTNEIFNQAAISAIMKSIFKPAIQYGKPIEVWITYPFKFRLSTH